MAAGTDNSTVKITIDVIDANSGEVISRINKNLSGMGAAGTTAATGVKKVEATLNEVGTAGTRAGQAVSKGLGDAGSHALTSLDSVRLFRDEFGIHIPRSMEKAMASSKLVMGALGSLQTAMIAVGGIGVAVALGSEFYKLGKDIFTADTAVQDFNKHLAEAAHQKFMDTASIEDVSRMLRQASSDLAKYDKQLATMPATAAGRFGQKATDGTGLLAAVADPLTGGVGVAAIRTYLDHSRKDTGEKRNQAQVDEDNGTTKRIEDQHADILSQIHLQKALADTMHGVTKAAAEQAVAMRENAEARRYANSRAGQQLDIDNRARRAKGLPDQPLAPDAGAREELRANAEAQGKTQVADAQEVEKNNDRTLKLKAEAHAAGLRGEEKYRYDVVEQERLLQMEITRSLGTGIAADAAYQKQRASLEEKYAAERKNRIDAEHYETSRMEAEANGVGLTGQGAVDQRHRDRVDALAKAAPDLSDPESKAKREAAEQRRYQAEQAKEQEQFTARLTQLDDGRANSSMTANQRIAVDARKTVAEIEKAWKEYSSVLGALDPRRVQGQADVNAAIAKVNADAVKQQADVRRSLLLETEKAEAEGGRRGLTREQEARQAILDDYRERYTALEDLRMKDADNADLYRRQEIAAEQVKNGKLIEQQREMRDKLAGQLRGFLDHPLDALKRQGEDMASKYAADLLLKLNKGGDIGSGGKHGGLFDVPLLGGNMLGGKMLGGKHDQAHPMAATSTTSSVSAASATMTAGSAIIHISGNATLAGAAPGGAGASAAVRAMSSGGGIGNTGARVSYASLPFSASPTGTGGTVDPGNAGTAVSGTAPGMPGAVSAANFSPVDSGVGKGFSIAQGGIGMAQSSTDLGQQIFGKDGPASTVATQGGALGKAAGTLGTAGAYVQAGAGLFSAYEGNGGFGGALNGALAGAQLGAMVGGPIGAAIGAAGGAILGFIGFGGANKANEYYVKEVRPRIANDVAGFGMGSMQYQQAYDDLVSLDKEARQKTKALGRGGKGVWDSHIHPEIINAQHQLTREQKAGRSQYGATAGQFHNGGLIQDFGTLGTTGDQGWIHAQRGEFVMQQQQVPSHYQALSMMQAGASHSDMAAYYAANMPAAGAATGGGNDVNLHFHSHDAKGAYDLFHDNKHVIRSVLNQSYAENSGGSDF